MKKLFPGFYGPTSDEFKTLWKKGLIVVDTNVLLTLYSLPTTRDEYMAIFESLKDRLWIPHQVALEFQKNRLGKIAEHLKSTSDALINAEKQIDDLCGVINSLQMDKRNLGIETAALVEDLEKSHKSIADAIKKTQESLPNISSSDSVRDQLDALFDGRIGEGPKNQVELDELIENAEARFAKKIPPGFLDSDKDKNPNLATFVFDHIEYQRKHGDLILWKQIIRHAKETNQEAVIFVTLDSKEDWWWKEQGKTLGPHSELVSEIKREAGVDIFWMYSAASFLQHANTYVNAHVSIEMVEEVEKISKDYKMTIDASQNSMFDSVKFHSEWNHNHKSYFSYMHHRGAQSMISLIMDWCGVRGDVFNLPPKSIFDFMIERNESRTGVIVELIEDPISDMTAKKISSLKLKIGSEARALNLTHLLLIFTVPVEITLGFDSRLVLSNFIRTLDLIIEFDKEIEIVIGTIKDEAFKVIFTNAQPRFN